MAVRDPCFYQGVFLWALRDSNPRHPRCKRAETPDWMDICGRNREKWTLLRLRLSSQSTGVGAFTGATPSQELGAEVSSCCTPIAMPEPQHALPAQLRSRCVLADRLILSPL